MDDEMDVPETNEDPLFRAVEDLIGLFAIKDEERADLIEGVYALVVGKLAELKPESEVRYIDNAGAWVKYIGRRESYSHRAYGIWTSGLVQKVEKALATEMVTRHPDVFACPDPSEIPEDDGVRIEKPQDEEVEEDMVQRLRDQVMALRSKADIVRLIKDEYQIDINKELQRQGIKVPKIADLQQAALVKIDQYGLNS